MALRNNEALRTKMADDFADLWDGGTIQIRTGGQPADPDSAASGTLLATINLPTPAFGAASVGVVSKSGTWNTVATDSGIAGWARFINAAATRSFDVTVAEVGGDLTIDIEDILVGGVVTVTAFTYTIPES